MSNTTDNILRIAVISDLHVMAPELLVNEGPAIEEYLADPQPTVDEKSPE